MYNERVYQIALTLIPGVGPVKARSLVAFCGSAEAVFREKKSLLRRIPDIGEMTAAAVAGARVPEEAVREDEFIRKYSIKTAFITEPHYPDRLRLCEDAPAMLFWKGNHGLNSDKIISVVGTRKATAQGKEFCDRLIGELAPHHPAIVSGLAFGVDICAHKAALRHGLPSVACLAHGLGTLYPPAHKGVAREMLVQGALVTEFISAVKPDPPLFPSRNRIIAGLADCTVVIESDVKGGSLITAYIANSYGREVFAVPGRTTDQYSGGCHLLIRRNLAAIITSAADLLDYMNWGNNSAPAAKQLDLFADLSPEQAAVIQILQQQGRTAIDEMSNKLKKPVSRLSALLLEMEFSGFVKSLPGKMYEVA